MSANLVNLYTQSFANTQELLLQQEDSRLQGAVMVGNHTGKQASPVDQFGAISPNKVSGRFNPKLRTDAPVDRRWVYPQDYDLSQLVDSFDMLRLILDPRSVYNQNARAAMLRARDEEIIAAFFGAAKTGETGGTTTSFPSANAVSVLQGAASATNLTVAKLKEAVRLLMSYNNDLSAETVYCAITATEHDSLLDEIQVTSSDFNGGMPVLVDGRIRRFMGIEFIHTELLQTGSDDQSGTSTAIPVWLKSGMHLGIWGDLQTDIDQNKQLTGNPWEIYCMQTVGATRTQENKVIKIWAR